ncbi:cytochrome-b5 reductase [Sistotremastrum niveocremeum HHB9708]|uniref:NADH-cytochrome b5 reductase n=1 Tax=Sistotremastrum niveocremeum HHB9708 TaxID=1314777 RepID=A0A164UI93_9AGAM|nr:cytochrome-b5 reductase [Sistotremastrum niveocremeum HHB9708]
MFRTALSRTALRNTRRYATSAPASSGSNWAIYLAGAGAAGLGAYVYLGQTPETPKKPIQEKSPLDPKNFVDFKLKKVEPYNHNTAKFIFELPEDQASLLPVASCVVVKASDPEALKDSKGKPIIRPYTPVSPSDAPGELAFLIKKYDSGNASKYIHELKVGDSLAIKGPIAKFDFKINQFDEVGLIGGGSGITPLYQIVEYALSKKDNKTKFKLIFANETEADILLREEFDSMKKKYPDTFDVVYVVTKPEKPWKGKTGYVTKEIIKETVASPDAGDKVKLFICGPPGQVAAVAGKKDGMKQGELGGILKELGYTSDQVFKF